ncbi:MAG: peptidoglycan-binding protein [Gemmatimonadetes bacterium]|nr:peptidoglycan-binding protein [Gemmatimonadota bacterium]
MTSLRLLAAFLLLAAHPPAARASDPDPRPACRVDAAGRRVCCRTCSRGKACGNSCIAAYKTCHRGVGCACDAGGGSSSGSRLTATARPAATMREVQRMLKRLGYYGGEINGVDGAATRAAVRAFQRDSGIRPADGIAGTATRARLRREASRGG